MRTCASCGKANNPIRKYCTRCGKSLLIIKDDKPSPAPTSVITETQIPDVQPTTSIPADTYVRSDTVKATTDDEWVRPSQVSRDRVRSSASASGKSEMEKAQEAFARADGVGIEEPDGSGVIETRMLRASEVRELMGEGAVLPQEPTPPDQPVTPASTPPPVTPVPTPAAPPVAPVTPPVATPAPIPSPAATAPATPAPPTTNKLEPAIIPVHSVETPRPAAPPSMPIKPPTPTITSAASISLDTRVPEIEDILSHVTEPEDLQDSKIKDLIAGLTTQHAELRTVKEDMANVSGRLDEFVRSCQNDAEVKRIHYESLCEQERFAKQEYESSKKEYERVDKRRKKEVSSLEGKVKNVEKNISKSEDAVKKRVDELDKVREKIAQLQATDS